MSENYSNPKYSGEWPFFNFILVLVYIFGIVINYALTIVLGQTAHKPTTSYTPLINYTTISFFLLEPSQHQDKY